MLPDLPARSITALDDDTRFVVVHQTQVTICDASHGVSLATTRAGSGSHHAVTGDGRWMMSLAAPPQGDPLQLDELGAGPPIQFDGTWDDFAYQILAIPTTAAFVVVQSDGSNNGNYNWLDLIDPTIAAEGDDEGEGDDGERIVDDSSISRIAQFDNHGAAWLADPDGKRLFGLFEHGVAMVRLDEDDGESDAIAMVFGTLDEGDEDEEQDSDSHAADLTLAGPAPLLMTLAGSRLVHVAATRPDQLTVQIFDVDQRQRVTRLVIAHPWSPADVAHIDRLISVDREARRMLLVEGATVSVLALDGEPTRPLTRDDAILRWTSEHPISHAAFLGDGHHAVTIAGRALAIWNLDQQAAVHVVELAGEVTAWAVSRTGAVAIADASGALTLGQLDGYSALAPTARWTPTSDEP